MTGWRKGILGFLILLLTVIPGFGDAQQAPKGTIKIYTSWPMQGGMIPEGTAMKRAVDLAVEHSKGVVAGYRIQIVNLDDASPVTGTWDGTIEAENAQKAVADKDAMAYIGTYNSGAAKVSMPITNKAGLVQITPANTYPGLTKPGFEKGEPDIYRPSGQVNYFRTHAADDLQGGAGAAWSKCLGLKRIFVLDDRQLYGKGIADVFDQEARRLGLQVVGHEGVESTAIDFRALLTKVKAAKPDLVYGGFVIDSGGVQIIQQMKALGMFDGGMKFMGPDGLYSPGLVEQATPAAVNNNVYLTFPGLPPDQLPGDAAKRFYNDYKAKYKEEPIGWSLYAYQSTTVILDAVKRAGVKDRAKILSAVRNTKNFPGITGIFSFDKNGDTTVTDMAGYLVKDGKFQFLRVIGKDMKC
ncbi:MAG: branched-chain amino acid ABC transporter substrate-binding protein [candidate division NC10 bacterium]|nr:branched-chain amino acid ABC transporter substrate-binding protein [candidate division NC10 bacterium]